MDEPHWAIYYDPEYASRVALECWCVQGRDHRAYLDPEPKPDPNLKRKLPRQRRPPP